MPITSVSYFTGAGQPAFTTATPVSGLQYIDPPAGVTEFQGVRQQYWQLASSYTAPTLSTAATYLSTACYLTGDTGFSPVGGGVMEWTREYRRIPTTYTEYIGSMAYTFPGRDLSTSATTKTITAIGSIANDLATYTVAGHGYTAGAVIKIKVVYTNNFSWQWNAYVVSTTTDTFVARHMPAGAYNNGVFTAYTFSTGTVYSASSFGSSARTRGVSAYIVHEFCLPGVTSGYSTVADFKPLEIFDVIDTYGNHADKLTSTTIPSISEYNALVANGVGLVVDSVVERYAGNIYVRKTKYVTAI